MSIRIGTMHRHDGVCDASAAVFARPGSTEFLVADDEDQSDTVLRLYDAVSDGPPLREFRLSNDVLDTDPDEPEIDVEASAWLGERIFWIGSHSRSKKGKKRRSRQRMFATAFNGAEVQITGKPYCTLLDDVSLELALELDNKLPPKDGGISIEGLSATERTGELLIAFRSPLIDGCAPLIQLKNADHVVDRGETPLLAGPILLDCDGLGVRSIDYWPERKAYYLLAGPAGDNGKEFQLMRWSGPSSSRPEIIEAVDFAAMEIGDDESPEALLIEPATEAVYVLFDEGNRMVNGVKCKDAERKSFRSLSVWGL
jgi:hypothetical protein